VSFASEGPCDAKLICRFLQQFLEDHQIENMTLQERFPQDRTSRTVLANALFHTCCLLSLTCRLIVVLATRGVIIVTQDEPYGDISLKMAI
jgi:hypothetical protein